MRTFAAIEGFIERTAGEVEESPSASPSSHKEGAESSPESPRLWFLLKVRNMNVFQRSNSLPSVPSTVEESLGARILFFNVLCFVFLFSQAVHSLLKFLKK